MAPTRTPQPNTRARVSARRKARKAEQSKQATRERVWRQRATPAQPVRKPEERPAGLQRLPVREKTGRAPDSARKPARQQKPPQARASFGAVSDVLRRRQARTQAWMHERQAAYERRRRAKPAETHVRPGPRQSVLEWVISGRLFSLALFLVSVGVLIYSFVSPDFQVQQVRVEGNSVLDSAEVADLSSLQGQSIWAVNTAQAHERLLQNAYIEQASIRVAVPNRATVEVTERRPEVRWQVGNMQYLVAASGLVLDVAAEPAEPGTLVIVGSSQQASLEPMDQVDPDALELAHALALRLPVEVGFEPASIGWEIALGVYVKSQSGQTIVFGRTDNLDRKLMIFRHLLEDGTAFTYMDLRPSNPFYRNEQ
jgi:cell division protein FtsQ